MIFVNLANRKLNSLDFPQEREKPEVFHQNLLREYYVQWLGYVVIQVECIPTAFCWFR